MSSIDDECELNPILDRPPVRIPIIVTYIVVFLICLIGNLFTILVICAHRSMRTATNFFLANLAVADLLVAIFCICQNMFHLVGTNDGRWIFGATMCKLYALVLHLVPCTGIGILVCVSVEKYIAGLIFDFISVLHPLLALKVLTPRFRVLLMASIWAVSLMFNLPYYTFTNYIPYSNNVAVCTRHRQYNSTQSSANNNSSIDTSDDTSRSLLFGLINSRKMVTSSFVLWYCIPLVIIVFLYTRIGFVLWHSAPLKQLTQVGTLRSNSNETTTIVNMFGSGKTRGKRSVTHPPPPPPTANAKRTNSANECAMAQYCRGMGLRLRSETTSSVESGGREGSEEGRKRNRDQQHEELISADGERHAERTQEGTTDTSAQQWNNGQRTAQTLPETNYKSNKNNEHDTSAHAAAKETFVTLGTPNGTVLVGTVESRKKVIRLLIAIVSSFAVLTLPHHLRLVHSVWTDRRMCNNSLEPLVQPVTYLLLFLSSSCNPFLYAFMSQRFRAAIRDIFNCRRGRARRKSVRTQNSDVVACTTTFGGGSRSAGGGATAEESSTVPLGLMPMGMPLFFSSLSRLNSVTGPSPGHNDQSQLCTAGSERNLLLAKQTNNGQQQKPKTKKSDRKMGQNPFGTVCSAHRYDGITKNIAVVYRKGANRTQ